MRLWVRSLALLSGLRIQHCCELWCGPAVIAPIRPLAWESPYAVGAALEKEKRQKIKNKKIIQPKVDIPAQNLTPCDARILPSDIQTLKQNKDLCYFQVPLVISGSG